MGEPLNNYNNVIKAVRRMIDELGIGSRHITISTVGVAPRIRMLADEGFQVWLEIRPVFCSLNCRLLFFRSVLL